jgi:ferrous iron transport protein A
MRIDLLQPGQSATITRIDDSARDSRRLRELGFDEGVEVEVRHRGMFGGDPIAVYVGGNLVAMRQSFARLVDVTPAARAAE